MLAGGAFGIIKSANIFTQKNQYQATDRGTENNNPAETLSEIYNKIDLEKINLNETMIASTIGSFSDTKYDGIKELKERILARNTILNQINNQNLTSNTKKLKFEEILSSIDSEIKKRVGTIVTPIIIEQIVIQKSREIIEGVLSND